MKQHDLTASVAAARVHVRVPLAAAWRTWFWTAFGVLAVVKLWLAAQLSPFVDEAFYWQESRHLAWSYGDVPGLTAWLIAAGEFAFGHSTLAMRAPFLVIGALVPLVMVHMVTRLFDARAGWQAGLWTLLMPLSGTLGVLALPDVPLTLATLVALDAFERSARSDRRRDWLLLGGALAVTWLAHYRAAMPMLAGLAFLVLTARGRSLWRLPGLWISLVVAAFGLLPLLAFNLQHDWSAIGFQLVERHPWTFHADALVQALEQAVVVTPLLYGLLIVVLIIALRRWRGGAPWDLFACAALVPLLAYFIIGLFADDERFRVHWPLPGYLPLLALLPVVLRNAAMSSRRSAWAARAFAMAAAAVAAAGSVLVLVYLALATQTAGAAKLSRYKAFPEHFVGWNEAGRVTRQLLANDASNRITLVADNFMLAAELDFAFAGARPVYALDSPLNAKHGRAMQLSLWALDEAALRALGRRRALLVVDETALRERDRAAWLDALCSRIDDMRLLQQFELTGGRKRIAFYSGIIVSGAPPTRRCTYPPSAALPQQ